MTYFFKKINKVTLLISLDIGLPVHRFAPLTAKRINRYLLPSVALSPPNSSPSFRSNPLPMPVPDGRLHATVHPVKGLFSSLFQGSSFRSLTARRQKETRKWKRKRDAFKRHLFSYTYQLPSMKFIAFSACPAATTSIRRSSLRARNHPCRYATEFSKLFSVSIPNIAISAAEPISAISSSLL